MEYRTLVADPPWRFSDSLPGPGRGAAKHYATMSVDDICAFELPPLAPDAYLILWRVASMQEEALRVCRAWGFKPTAEVVWVKLTSTGKPHFGMGHHTRAAHEAAILATRGKAKPLSRSVRDTFAAKVGRHSAKPDEFYDLVDRLCPGPTAELFARRRRPGWACFGDELPALPTHSAATDVGTDRGGTR